MTLPSMPAIFFFAYEHLYGVLVKSISEQFHSFGQVS